MRDTLALGIVLSLALGLANLMYAPAFWLVLLVLVALAWRRRERVTHVRPLPLRYAIVIPVVVFAAWHALVRPLLEGDSLWYHLPNAAAWSHAHGVWIASTAYWWYPAASELFASALYTVSGPASIGCANALAVLLIGWRSADLARAYVDETSAGLVGAAIVLLPSVALQAGSLNNDVWQSAFFLEMLVASEAGFARAAVMETFVKPQSAIFTALAVAATGRVRALLSPALAVLGLWIARDAVLLALHPPIVPADTAYPIWRTTIAAHLPGALLTLARAAWNAGIPTFVGCLCGALSFAFTRAQRPLRIAGCLAFAIYLLLPFGFDNGMDMLGTGSSLRYGQIAAIAGLVIATAVAARVPRLVSILAIAAIAAGAIDISARFWTDGWTHTAWIALLLAIAGVAISERTHGRTYAAFAIVLLALAGASAARDPVSYYDDWLSNGTARTRFFDWLADAKPPRILTVGIPSGAIAIVSPHTATADELHPERACEDARKRHALVLSRTGVPIGSCGKTLYRDALVAVSSGD